ncbi:heterokaryon incompatibility protein-domain-containing protein [Podospora australis]|uniref:Heterokaryon incompatibility protein-domain-containing protein n=1 Tax=Podospora australis TaxID=1536484 RepID=A0AAN6WW89_9PEZI|nr:heterokaryon incompatibility protein-domain-containing protein [Podospora australis]
MAVYQSLTDAYHIRILQIAPSDDKTAPILASFHVESLAQDPPPEFEALSYMWGDQTQRADISLDNVPFSISQRLHGTIQNLRHANQPRRLWIDAICINQNDVQERNQQVQLMRMIYQRAKAVLVWLDEVVDTSHAAFDKLQALSEASQISDLGKDPDLWDPLCEIFKNPYWSRVWIQQEISSAGTLHLFCREIELSTYSIFHLLILFSQVQLEDILGPSWFDWALKKPSVTLPPRFGTRDPHLQPRNGTTIGGTQLDLLETLSKINTLQCTDQRDRVYGIMFLAQDCNEGDVKIDYNLTLPEVYAEVVQCVISKYRSTRFLLYSSFDYARMPGIAENTSSWVPDWRRPPVRPSMARTLPGLDELTPPADTRGNNCNLPTIVEGVLSLHAIKVGTVSKTYHELFTKDLLVQSISEFVTTCLNITKDAIELSHSASGLSMTSTEDELYVKPEDSEQWRALMRTFGGLDHRDRVKHPDFDTILYQGAKDLLTFSRQRDEDFDPDTCQVGKIVHLPPGPAANEMKFVKVLISFAWWIMTKHHAPFVTVDGRVGMAPDCVQGGDEIWLVPGCEAPVFLRPCGGHWLVAGEAYLDGSNLWEPLGGMKRLGDVSDGEMLGDYQVQVIQLR